jgi:hypothetical protein
MAEDALRPKVQHTIRIRTAQVDVLLNLVSEVVISQIKAEQRSLELRMSQSELADVWQAWVRLKSVLSTLSSVDDSLLMGMTEDMSAFDGLLTDRRRSLAKFLKAYPDDVSRTSIEVFQEGCRPHHGGRRHRTRQEGARGDQRSADSYHAKRG